LLEVEDIEGVSNITMRATKQLKRYRNIDNGLDLLNQQSKDLKAGIVEYVTFYIPTKVFESEEFLETAEKLNRFSSKDLNNGYTMLISLMVVKAIYKVTPNSYFRYKFHTIFKHSKIITIGDTLVYGYPLQYVVKNFIENNLS